MYVFDFLLTPAIAIIALASIWHAPTRNLIMGVLPLLPYQYPFGSP
jgi:hypothetical protein